MCISCVQFQFAIFSYFFISNLQVELATRMSTNLTGHKRIIKDACIGLCNEIQKWNSTILESHSLIVSICMLRHKQLCDYEEYVEGEKDSSIIFEPDEMILLSSQLKSKFKNLELTVYKMKKYSEKIKATYELESSDLIFFQSLPLSKFCQISEELRKMYLKELQVREKMLSELFFINEKSVLTFFETYWKYQPYLDQDRVNEITDNFLSELELN